MEKLTNGAQSAKEIFYRYFTPSDYVEFSRQFFHTNFLEEDLWEEEEAGLTFLKLILLAGLTGNGMVDINQGTDVLTVKTNGEPIGELYEGEFSSMNEFGESTFQGIYEGYDLKKLKVFLGKTGIDWGLFYTDLKNFKETNAND